MMKIHYWHGRSYNRQYKGKI